MTSIEAKIAVVFDDYRVALNAGSIHGVAVGDRVQLYTTVDVKDPDTREPLGTVRLRKTVLQVVTVEPKLAIAEVPMSAGVGANWSSSAFRSILGEAPRRKVRLVENGASAGDPAEVLVAPGEQVTITLSEIDARPVDS